MRPRLTCSIPFWLARSEILRSPKGGAFRAERRAKPMTLASRASSVAAFRHRFSIRPRNSGALLPTSARSDRPQPRRISPAPQHPFAELRIMSAMRGPSRAAMLQTCSSLYPISAPQPLRLPPFGGLQEAFLSRRKGDIIIEGQQAITARRRAA